MSAKVKDARASTAPEKVKPEELTPLYYAYNKNGRPRQRYLIELVAALPAKSDHLETRRGIPTGNGAKRRGISRAELRREVRKVARDEEREFTPKVLPLPAWRNVPYAFRRFNPIPRPLQGVAINVREAV